MSVKEWIGAATKGRLEGITEKLPLSGSFGVCGGREGGAKGKMEGTGREGRVWNSRVQPASFNGRCNAVPRSSLTVGNEGRVIAQRKIARLSNTSLEGWSRLLAKKITIFVGEGTTAVAHPCHPNSQTR